MLHRIQYAVSKYSFPKKLSTLHFGTLNNWKFHSMHTEISHTVHIKKSMQAYYCEHSHALSAVFDALKQ